MGRGSVKTGAMETESYRVVRGRKKRIFFWWGMMKVEEFTEVGQLKEDVNKMEPHFDDVMFFSWKGWQELCGSELLDIIANSLEAYRVPRETLLALLRDQVHSNKVFPFRVSVWRA